MKPSEKQIKVIDECITQLQYWKNTNDINSPTHYGDITAGMESSDLFDLIGEDKANDVEDALIHLLNCIKQV